MDLGRIFRWFGGTLADGAGVDLKINSYVYEQLADGTRLLSLNGTTDEDAHIGRALHATTSALCGR